MSRYRKVHVKIWNDEKFLRFTDDGKLVFLFLMTHPHMTSVGAMRASPAGLAAELGWNTPRMEEALHPSVAEKMVIMDKITSFIWLPNFLDYNRPESPNAVRSWKSQLEMIPESMHKPALIDHLREFTKGMGEAFREAFREALGEVTPQPSPIQEQDTGTGALAVKSTPKAPGKGKTTPAIPLDLLESKTEIDKWLAFKAEKGQTYKGQQGLNALWGKLRAMGTPTRRAAAIQHSMANNYQGIFEPKGGRDGKAGNGFRADGKNREGAGRTGVVL